MSSFTPTTTLRSATEADLPLINPMILRSKAHWGYDAVFMKACVDELTLTPSDITENPTIVAVFASRIIGVARINLSDAAVLEELYVDPAAMGQGAGRVLFNWCRETARAAGCTIMTLDADPQAEPFYQAMGATRIGLVPSGSIADRFLPQMSFEITS